MKQLEGKAASKFIEVIRNCARNDYDRFRLGTISAPPPGLRLQIDNMRIELDAGDVIVAGSVAGLLETGDRVICVSMNGGQLYVILDKAVIY